MSSNTVKRRRSRTVRDLSNPLPSDIPNLLMWQRGDQGTYTDLGITPAQSGQTIQQWNDLSGNGNHLIRNGGPGAVVQTNGINGQTVLSFSTNSSYAPSNLTIWPVSPGRTQLFVWRSTSTSPGALTSGANSAAATHAWFFSLGLDNIYPTNTSTTEVGFLTKSTATLTNTNYSSMERFNGWNGYSTVYRNGNVIGVNLNSIPIPAAITADLAMQIGVYKTGSAFWNGYIAEHILFNRAVSGVEIQRLNRYIYNRYGIGPSVTGPILVFAGNSLTYGTNAVPTTNLGTCNGSVYPGQTMTALAGYGNFNAVNCGVGSQTTTMTLSYAVPQIEPLLQEFAVANSWCLYWEITNTLSSVASGVAGQTQAYSDVVNYCLARRAKGFKVAVFTCLPRGSSTQFETDRQAVNALIRANWTTFADALCDIGNDPTKGQAGDHKNVIYYNQTDLTHLTNSGYAFPPAYAVAAITGNPYVAPPAPAVRTATSSANWLGTTGMSTPASAVAGDTLIIATVNTLFGIGTPTAGWTAVGSSGSNVNSGIGLYQVYKKTAVGGAETFALTGAGSTGFYSGICIAVQKGAVDSSVFGDNQGTTASTTVLAPSVTPTGSTDVGICVYEADGAPTITVSATQTPLGQITNSHAASVTIALGWAQLSGTGAWAPDQLH